MESLLQGGKPKPGLLGLASLLVVIKETVSASLRAQHGLFDLCAGSLLAAQIGFFYFITVTQLFSRTGQGDISGFDNIGLMSQR